jgi:hypothetical protein
MSRVESHRCQDWLLWVDACERCERLAEDLREQLPGYSIVVVPDEANIEGGEIILQMEPSEARQLAVWLRTYHEAYR